MDIKPQGNRTDKARIRDLLPEIDKLIEQGYYIPAIYASLKKRKLIFKSEANFKCHYYFFKNARKQNQPEPVPNSVESNEDADSKISIIDGFDIDEQQRVAQIIFDRKKGN